MQRKNVQNSLVANLGICELQNLDLHVNRKQYCFIFVQPGLFEPIITKTWERIACTQRTKDIFCFDMEAPIQKAYRAFRQKIRYVYQEHQVTDR